MIASKTTDVDSLKKQIAEMKNLVLSSINNIKFNNNNSNNNNKNKHNLMALWEVQLNFATHCATSGLGVSTEHPNTEQPLAKALYRFHTHYDVMTDTEANVDSSTRNRGV